MSKFGFYRNSIVKPQDEYINLPLDFRHTMIVGQTGCGKTTSAILPIIKDRLEKGHGMLIFDYKGEEHKKVKKLALQAGRLKDVYMLNTPWGIKVNIAKEASLETIIKEIKQGYLYAGEKNHYFTQNATTYFSNVLMILFEIQKISNMYKYLGKDINCNIPSPSIKEVLNILQSEENYNNFCKNINKYYKEYIDITLTQIINLIKDKIVKIHEYVSIFKKTKENVLTFIIQNSDCIEVNKNIDTSSNFSRNVAPMIESLNKFSYMDCLNTDGNSLSKLLNDGKIIIVNTEDFDETMLSLILNSVLENLTRRKAKGYTNGISIIIDEAQKVLNRYFDLHTDVLREAKCEIVLSFQNIDLMIEKITPEKYMALQANLCNQYFFKNDSNMYRNLDIFECYIKNEDKKTKLKPIFFSNDELIKAEYKYQQKNNIIPNFAANQNKNNHILEYCPYLYKTTNNVVYKNIKSKKTKEICIITKEEKEEIEEELKEILEDIYGDLNRFKTIDKNNKTKNDMDEILEGIFRA